MAAGARLNTLCTPEETCSTTEEMRAVQHTHREVDVLVQAAAGNVVAHQLRVRRCSRDSKRAGRRPRPGRCQCSCGTSCGTKAGWRPEATPPVLRLASGRLAVLRAQTDTHACIACCPKGPHLVHVLEEVVVRLPAQHALRLVSRGKEVHRAAKTHRCSSELKVCTAWIEKGHQVEAKQCIALDGWIGRASRTAQ